MLAATLVNAQESGPAEMPESRRYTVEVIIFEYAEQVSVGTEVFEPDPPPEQDADPPPEFVFEDTKTERQTVAPDGNSSERPEYVVHSEDEFTLTDVMRRLKLLDVYEPVMHFAWTQVTLPDQETLPIDLTALAAPPEHLKGSFRLYLSRYLHLVVDLEMEEELDANRQPVAIGEPDNVYSDNRSGTGYEAMRAPATKLRIQEDRIFKSGELRYFDHPRFGVLAKITRVEDGEEEQEPMEPEMLGDGPAG